MTHHTACRSHIDTPPDRPLEGAEEHLVGTILSTLIQPDAVVETVICGNKFVAVTAGGRMGMAALLGAAPRDGDLNMARQLTGHPVKDAAELVRSPNPFRISLGFAAVNAANAPSPDRIDPEMYPADDLIARLGKDKITGLVGEFPFTDNLKTRVGKFHLFELQPVPEAVPRDQWKQVLPRLDVFAVTGTALLTRGMAWFLSRASRATIVVLGPTTPYSPALFRFGVDYLCGSVVTDQDRVAQGIRAGLPFRQVKRGGGIVFTQWEPTRAPFSD